MDKYTIEINNEITDEMNEVIGSGLNAYNDEITKYSDRQPLAIVVRDKKMVTSLAVYWADRP